MDNILQFEWMEPENERTFLRAEDLENCVTEKILRNTFHDPLVSSSDDEEQPNNINWDEVFNKKQNDERNHRVYIPGLRGVPKYPKLSALKPLQHIQCLKVLCAQHPNILPLKPIGRPGKTDFKMFESLKSIYETEQKEFLAWAKTLWASEHCIRALRPKPPVELVYEAQFKLKANELKSYPKNYGLAAQIPMDPRGATCEMIHSGELINVNISDLPQIAFDTINEKINIIKPCAVPEPCNKHPCKFILPMENSVTILPLTEIERELAQYAHEHGAQFIASENALKTLLALDQAWNIPVCVCEVMGSDGDSSNVVVLGSEFAMKKESALVRTYRAFRHLLEDTLVPISEKAKIIRKQVKSSENNIMSFMQSMDVQDDEDSDQEQNNLCIDTGEDLEIDETTIESQDTDEQTDNQDITNVSFEETVKNDVDGNIGFYECTCKETIFERPPPRSFTKWQLKNKVTSERHDLIVHCSHKMRDGNTEIILEPVPEYQLELGATALSDDKLASLALSLHLRKNADLMIVRADGSSGELVTMERLDAAFRARSHAAFASLHAALQPLHALLPGHYILKHEAALGANALLYSPKVSSAAPPLTLQFELAPAAEGAALKAAPALGAALLPLHKFRRILPCAFTPYQDQMPKPSRKPSAPSKSPPKAIRWPRQNKRKRKKK